MFDVDTLAQRWDLPLPGKGGERGIIKKEIL